MTQAALRSTAVRFGSKARADARGWPFHSANTTADAHGKFGLLGMPSNVYRVWAGVDKQASTRTTVNLTKDLRVEVRLVVEDSALSGTVVDSRGNPVPDVFVRAWSTAGLYKNEVTDRHGAFDFGGLPPARTRSLVAIATTSRRTRSPQTPARRRSSWFSSSTRDRTLRCRRWKTSLVWLELFFRTSSLGAISAGGSSATARSDRGRSCRSRGDDD